MNLQERIAKTLGWTVKDVQSFSLPALRDMVRPTNPKLANEITRVIEGGYHLKSNPNISTPMIALFGMLVAGAVYLFTRKTKAEEKPKTTPMIPKEAICLVTTEQLFKWGGLNKYVPLHLRELSQAPELPALQQTFPNTKVAVPENIVVVLKDGSFWTYAGGKPTPAPELRKKYCESQK